MVSGKEKQVLMDFAADYSRVDFGIPGTLLNRVLLLDPSGRPTSMWNGINMCAKESVPGGFVVNCVCKTPKDTWAKYEVAELELFHPLRMGKYAGRPAHFSEDIQWNVGMIPQTSAEPTLVREEDGASRYAWKPLEVVDVGPSVVVTGEVYPVKPLGAYLVVDPNTETFTWKIIGVAALASIATQLNDIADLESLQPGSLISLQAWLRTGECFGPDVKRKVLGLGGKVVGREEAIHAIREAHGWWRRRQSKQLPSAIAPLPPNLTPRVVTAIDYKPLWQAYVNKEANREAIPLADPTSGSSSSGGGPWGFSRDAHAVLAGLQRLPQIRKLSTPPGREFVALHSGDEERPSLSSIRRTKSADQDKLEDGQDQPAKSNWWRGGGKRVQSAAAVPVGGDTSANNSEAGNKSNMQRAQTRISLDLPSLKDRDAVPSLSPGGSHTTVSSVTPGRLWMDVASSSGGGVSSDFSSTPGDFAAWAAESNSQSGTALQRQDYHFFARGHTPEEGATSPEVDAAPLNDKRSSFELRRSSLDLRRMMRKALSPQVPLPTTSPSFSRASGSGPLEIRPLHIRTKVPTGRLTPRNMFEGESSVHMQAFSGPLQAPAVSLTCRADADHVISHPQNSQSQNSIRHHSLEDLQPNPREWSPLSGLMPTGNRVSDSMGYGLDERADGNELEAFPCAGRDSLRRSSFHNGNNRLKFSGPPIVSFSGPMPHDYEWRMHEPSTPSSVSGFTNASARSWRRRGQFVPAKLSKIITSVRKLFGIPRPPSSKDALKLRR